IFLPPSEQQSQAAITIEPEDYPLTELPKQALGFSVQLYGMDQHWKLFTARQLKALVSFSDLVKDARSKVLSDAKAATGVLPVDERPLEEGGLGARAYADAVATYLATCIDRLAMTGNQLCRWNPVGPKAQHCFGRQALSMIWDFAEVNFFSQSTGSLSA